MKITRRTVERLLGWYTGSFTGEIVPCEGGHWIEVTLRFPFSITPPDDLAKDLIDEEVAECHLTDQ